MIIEADVSSRVGQIFKEISAIVPAASSHSSDSTNAKADSNGVRYAVIRYSVGYALASLPPSPH